MKTAILILGQPPRAETDEQQQLLSAIADEREKRAQQSKGIEQLHGTSWQIDVQSELSFLCWCIATAHDHKIPCRVAFLDEPPDWIKLTPKA